MHLMWQSIRPGTAPLADLHRAADRCLPTTGLDVKTRNGMITSFRTNILMLRCLKPQASGNVVKKHLFLRNKSFVESKGDFKLEETFYALTSLKI